MKIYEVLIQKLQKFELNELNFYIQNIITNFIIMLYEEKSSNSASSLKICIGQPIRRSQPHWNTFVNIRLNIKI